MKRFIIEKVDTLSEEQLFEVKKVIDKIDALPVKDYDLLPHVENIVSERVEVLKKLAK